jgi:hypothetical protein
MEAVDIDTGKAACPTCFGFPNSGVPEEVEIPNILHCSYCKILAVWDDNTKEWQWQGCKSKLPPPFVDAKHSTFYCGCRGWD